MRLGGGPDIFVIISKVLCGVIAREDVTVS